jgi:hypothetical protein
MVFPPNCTGKDEIIPWGQKEQPSNMVRRVGYGEASRELIYFQQESGITHVKAPSSITVLKIFFMEYTP